MRLVSCRWVVLQMEGIVVMTCQKMAVFFWRYALVSVIQLHASAQVDWLVCITET